MMMRCSLGLVELVLCMVTSVVGVVAVVQEVDAWVVNQHTHHQLPHHRQDDLNSRRFSLLPRSRRLTSGHYHPNVPSLLPLPHSTRRCTFRLFMSPSSSSSTTTSSSDSSGRGGRRRRTRKRSDFVTGEEHSDEFLDVEFERVAKTSDDGDDGGDDDTPISVYSSSSSSSSADIDDFFNNNKKKKTLIDLSFETAAEEAARSSSSTSSIDWQKMRVPFTRGDEYIDCKVAFTVDYEDETYGIGVVYDTPVAIIVEEPQVDDEPTKNRMQQGRAGGESDEPDTKVTLVDPDQYTTNDDYAELMEIFAKQLHEQFGDQFYLRKTPKILTISGGIDQVTKNWEQILVPMKPYTTEALLDTVPGLLDSLTTTSSPSSETNTKTGKARKSSNDGTADTTTDPALQEFFDFMRKELGDEEVEETMNKEEFTKEELDLLKFIDIPGVGGSGDGDNMEDLINSIMEDLDGLEGNDRTEPSGGSGGGVINDAKQFSSVDIANTKALRLLGFEFRDTGEKYSLVQFLQPVTLVGRLCKNNRQMSNPSGNVMDESSQDDDNAAGSGLAVEFNLLTPGEEKVLIPKLEQLCRQDLADKGLTFQDK